MSAIYISLIFFALWLVFYIIYKKVNLKRIADDQNTDILIETRAENFSQPYKEQISLLAIINPIGRWTKYIWQEKYELINTQLSFYDDTKGYYENLVIAQQFLNKKYNRNKFYR